MERPASLPRLLVLCACLSTLAVLSACPSGRDRGGSGDDTSDDDDAQDDDTADDDNPVDDDDTADDDAADDDTSDDDTSDDDDATSSGDPCSEGGPVVLTLGTGEGTTACNSSWTEQGAVLSMVQGGPCDSGCAGSAESDGVWVYPAQLRVDLSGVGCTVTSAEMDVIDYTGLEAVEALLLDGSGSEMDVDRNSIVGSMDTLSVSGSNAAAALSVGGCETFVAEIRLY